MTFEEWFEKYNYQREYTVEEYVTAQAAWESAWDQQQRVVDEMHLMFRDNIEEITELREYINLGMSADARMVADAYAFMKEFDICPECRSIYGKHKMDCGRQR